MTFPDDPLRKVHGPYQRLNLFVDALKEIARLRFLFFVEPEVEVTPAATARYRERLSQFWGAEIELTLVRREDPAPPGRWETYGPPTLDAFRQPRFRWASGAGQRDALEKELESDPDVILAHRLSVMAPLLATRHPLPPVLFDLDDVEHRAFARTVSQPPVWPAKRLMYLHVPALWWAERRSAALARRTFVCSDTDRRYLERTMRVDGVRVVPNAVSVREDIEVPATGRTALFLGSLSYGPNRVAADYLAREIWPKVRERVPDARLVIAGRHPEMVPAHADPPPGVRFTGFVEDLDGLYADTRVMCVPILAGGGTRIKILEAAAHARPVVATTVGAEGLALEDGRHVLVRDTPDAFAEAVAGLLTDDRRARALGLAARDRIRHTYARDHVIPGIQEEVLSCVRAAA